MFYMIRKLDTITQNSLLEDVAYITAPNISRLFSEMIAIWVISTWEAIGKPKNLKLIELGPGDGSLTKVIIDYFKRFPELNNSINIYSVS